MTNHQDRQREVIDQIEKEVQENKLTFSTVEPVSDFDNDTRVCLTSPQLFQGMSLSTCIFIDYYYFQRILL